MMIGLTWLHISDRLQKGEKAFDRQVTRASQIRNIGGRSGAGPDLSVMNFITFSGNIDCSGKAEERDIVNGDLLGPLPKACDAGPDGLFMSPGSHDMDLVVFEKLPSEIKKLSGSEEGMHRKM
jgi:hypothetical protein